MTAPAPENAPVDAPPPPVRPPQGTRAELEETQIWWLRWIYVPTMSLIGLAALVVAILGGGDTQLALMLVFVVVGSLVGAGVGFARQRRETGYLSLDERDETRVMRTAGYAWCFAFLGSLAWAVVWAATHDDGTPTPLLVLTGLVVSLGLGRLCTRREGY